MLHTGTWYTVAHKKEVFLTVVIVAELGLGFSRPGRAPGGMRAIFGLRGSKVANKPAGSSASSVQKLGELLARGLTSIDRVSKPRERRKRTAALAARLNDVQSGDETIAVLAALNKANAAQLLLTVRVEEHSRACNCWSCLNYM